MSYQWPGLRTAIVVMGQPDHARGLQDHGTTLWPARRMAIEPGLHLMGWSRQQVIDFMVQSGRFEEQEARAANVSIRPFVELLHCTDPGMAP